MAPGLAFNTAASFGTNTNWQAYAGEIDTPVISRTVLGLTVQGTVSAGTGAARAGRALITRLTARTASTIGQFLGGPDSRHVACTSYRRCQIRSRAGSRLAGDGPDLQDVSPNRSPPV